MKFVTKKEGSFLPESLFNSVVEGPRKEHMNEFISEEAISFQQLRNGWSCSVSWQFCGSVVLRVLRQHSLI